MKFRGMGGMLEARVTSRKRSRFFCFQLPGREPLQRPARLYSCKPASLAPSNLAGFKTNKTISDGGITVDFWIIKVHTSN